ELGVVQAAYIEPVQQVFPGAELLEQAGDGQEGGLAGARGPRHGHELPLPHLDRKLAQRVGLDDVAAVHLGQAVHAEHGGSPPWASVRQRWTAVNSGGSAMQRTPPLLLPGRDLANDREGTASLAQCWPLRSSYRS